MHNTGLPRYHRTPLFKFVISTRILHSTISQVCDKYMAYASWGWYMEIPIHGKQLQYIPRNMHTVFALLRFVVVIHWLISPYPSGLLHWHCGNLTIAPVPAKQPWWVWNSCEFIMNDCVTTTKQSTTKPCACFLAQALHRPSHTLHSHHAGSGVGCVMYTLEGTKRSSGPAGNVARNGRRTA